MFILVREREKKKEMGKRCTKKCRAALLEKSLHCSGVIPSSWAAQSSSAQGHHQEQQGVRQETWTWLSPGGSGCPGGAAGHPSWEFPQSCVHLPLLSISWAA